MRAQLVVLFAGLAFMFANWSLNSCIAQEAKVLPAPQPENAPSENAQPGAPQPARPLPAPNQVIDIELAPQRAGVAMPAMRILPAIPGRALRNASGLPFDLSDLVLAKFDQSSKGPQLIALVEQTRMEQKKVTVTRVVAELRTRKVKVKDKEGKETEIDQEYNVAVPVTEEVEQMVPVPAGKKPTAFPLDELRIYRLDGTKVSEAEARKLLEKMSPVFFLRGFTDDIKAVDGVFLQALNPNCLIVVTEKAE